ncbi:dTDP-4-dehydrorhamnose 3,5-epimerase family protein [Rhizobium terrae]|uniref:dTDP-4-dehydrorhamnose 3,5-epimerase family protein n=1 Tax=Rhizobium terrae TaxID=2171756 RepID=UPI000E3D1875|nr:dTDP-4-dehydrorhamnose 3,5-epimerase family protein [Rhizobium terrae]
MSRFAVTDLPLAGLKRVERQNLGDSRGFLSRMFCADELAEAGWEKPIAQINLTMTAKKGTVRGMHFQHPPHSEMKLVNCVRGAVFDVAVDLRAGSPTFLKWHAEELSAENRRSLLIPEGFAHGFQTLTDDCELLYFHSAPHAAGFEGALNSQDPTLAITWPLIIGEMSERDRNHPYLTEQFTGLTP